MATKSNKNYEAIAKAKITTPRDMKNKRPPRILVYGRNKKGKTRFGMTAPNVLIIDPEHGTDQYEKQNPNVWHLDEWEEIDEVYKYLKLGKHPYEWVFLDGMTKIHNSGLNFVMRTEEERDLTRQPGFVQQRDYGKAGEMIKSMVWNYHTLPIGVIYSAQERMEKGSYTEDSDEEVEETPSAFVPDLPKGARASLNAIVGVIGRVYTVKTEIKKRVAGEIVEEMGIQRRLWLEPHVAYDTGYRSEYTLPPYVANPTIPKLLNLLTTGKAKA
jgi:hypothetical protein